MNVLILLFIIAMLLLIITALIIGFVMLRYSRQNRKVPFAIPIALVALAAFLALLFLFLQLFA